MSAQAETIYLGAGAAPVTVASGPGPLSASFGSYFTTHVALSASDPADPMVALSSTLDLTKVPFTAGGAYTYWASATDVSSTTPTDFLVTLGRLSGTLGISVTVTAYEDDSNAAYGTANELFSYTFSGLSAGTYSANYILDVDSPYSVTLRYDITTTRLSGGALTATGTIAVPEPSTWAMLITGFAGLGWAAFRRGVKVAAI